MTTDQQVDQRLRDLITQGRSVLQTQFQSGVFGDGPRVDYGKYHGWRARCRAALISLLGEGHSYVVDFDGRVKDSYVVHAEAGIAILVAVLSDLQGGYFRTLRDLISAEVFTNFLDMAEYLIEQDYKDAAAMLTGAVLEDGLKQIARSKDLQVKPRDDLTAVNSRCAEAGVYSRLVQKQIQVWVDIRNKAAHGEFEEYTAQHVKEMHAGVASFLATYLGK